MDFSLPAEVESLQARVRDFVAEEIMPLEADRCAREDHENIALDRLEPLRGRARAERLWSPQLPRAHGGLGLDHVAMAALYEEMNRSIFGEAARRKAAGRSGRDPSGARCEGAHCDRGEPSSHPCSLGIH
jgi:acyl-CoA dehydrogenase